MSSEGGLDADGERPRGKAPRSLTLTFAESHPWEMMVRDRLAALPRGYLKRLLLSLLEHSGLDLEDEARFRQQVERLLITRRLSRTLAAQSDEVLEREALAIEGVQRRMAPSRVSNEATCSQILDGQNAGDACEGGQTVKAHQPAEKHSGLSPTARGTAGRGTDEKQGFGALEL